MPRAQRESSVIPRPERIRAARKALKLTQMELAVKIGVSAEHICRIEKGRVAHLQPEICYGLCLSLGISREEMGAI